MAIKLSDRGYRRSVWLTASVLVITLSIAICFGWQAGKITAKAYLSQWLLQITWQQRRVAGETLRPWPGLDSYPIARLYTEDNTRGTVVLDNASGQALAFAPTLIEFASDNSDSNINTKRYKSETGKIAVDNSLLAIAGHRNTHLAFLEHSVDGDVIGLETVDGNRRLFRVSHRYIIDTRYEDLLVERSWQGLLLITCYPFDTLQSNGPLRLVVYASPVTG